MRALILCLAVLTAPCAAFAQRTTQEEEVGEFVLPVPAQDSILQRPTTPGQTGPLLGRNGSTDQVGDPGHSPGGTTEAPRLGGQTPCPITEEGMRLLQQLNPARAAECRRAAGGN